MAKTLYVDKTHGSASDATTYASNSASSPWLTVRRAVRGHASGNDASQAAAAGDTVIVRGNGQTYTENWSFHHLPSGWQEALLKPINNGTSGNPITIRAESGHAVTLTHNKSVIVNDQFNWIIGGSSWVRWWGFYLKRPCAFHDCTDSEVGWCDIDGTQLPDSTNGGNIIAGLSTGNTSRLYVHHCNIFGFRGVNANHAGWVLWTNIAGGTSHNSNRFEDNNVFNNWVGMYDKDTGFTNQHLRNWFHDNQQLAFQGNNQGGLASYTLAHNVIDDPVILLILSDGLIIHNNLYRAGNGQLINGTWNNVTDTLKNVSIFNNVARNTGPLAWRQEWTRTGNEFTYFNNNVYEGAPVYEFVSANQNLAFMQGISRELNSSQNITFSNIYNGSWVLQSPYTTFGRGGSWPSAVGPVNASNVSIVADILNTSRYGPAAFTGVTNQSPTAVLNITGQDGLDVDTDNSASVDPDGTIASRSTDWGDGTAPSTGTTPSHTYASGGTYNITLTVTDNESATGQDVEQVTVAASPGEMHELALASIGASSRRRGVRF